MLFNDLDNKEILVACCVATVKDDETCERLRLNLQTIVLEHSADPAMPESLWLDSQSDAP